MSAFRKPKPPKWIKLNEVAAVTGLQPATVLARAELGTFPPGTFRHSYLRWNEADVDAWIAEREAEQPPVPTCLYRHFDADGRLLYVGISVSALSRTCGHRAGSHWFQQVATITLQWFPSRPEAMTAEREAIKVENPMHNVQGAES